MTPIIASILRELGLLLEASRSGLIGRLLNSDVRSKLEDAMDKVPRERPVLTGRRAVASTLCGFVTGAMSLIAARLLVGAFGFAAPWVLPAVLVGAVAVGVVCALVLLPLHSRHQLIH